MRKNSLIIIITSLFFISVTCSNAWESKIKEHCVNENLDPCSTPDVVSNNYNIGSNSNNVNIEKKIKKSKKIINKKVIQSNDNMNKAKSKKIVNKNEINDKMKKIQKINLVKKNNKKKITKNLPYKQDTNYNFDKNMSFNDFKALVINYTDNSNYPNLNN